MAAGSRLSHCPELRLSRACFNEAPTSLLPVTRPLQQVSKQQQLWDK